MKTSELRAEAVHLFGADGAETVERFLRFLAVWDSMLSAPSGHALDDPPARAPAVVRKELSKLARDAESIAGILSTPDIRWSIQRAGLSEAGLKLNSDSDLIDGWIARLVADLQVLKRLADYAAMEHNVRKGPRPSARRLAALTMLAGWMAREGLALGTGENSKYIRAARIVFSRLQFDDDPRDAVRRYVAAGSLRLKEIRADAEYMRSAGLPKGVGKRGRELKSTP